MEIIRSQEEIEALIARLGVATKIYPSNSPTYAAADTGIAVLQWILNRPSELMDGAVWDGDKFVEVKEEE